MRRGNFETWNKSILFAGGDLCKRDYAKSAGVVGAGGKVEN